jgi:ABC-type antimicrobial peptide transport system permease subunit
MVLRRTLVLAMAGITLGGLGALGLTRVLAKFLFGVGPSDPTTFAIVAVLLATAALVAGLLPARRASRIDPLVALRYD